MVGSGEFEVLATQVHIIFLSPNLLYCNFLRLYVDLMLSSQLQEESHGDVPRILQHYTAEKLSSFGELALMWVFSC